MNLEVLMDRNGNCINCPNCRNCKKYKFPHHYNNLLIKYQKNFMVMKTYMLKILQDLEYFVDLYLYLLQ